MYDKMREHSSILRYPICGHMSSRKCHNRRYIVGISLETLGLGAI
jgi:hypothetical protein